MGVHDPSGREGSRGGRHGGWRRAAAALAVAALLVTGCGGGTEGGDGGGGAGGPSVRYQGGLYFGIDPALTKLDPSRAIPIGKGSEVTGGGIDGDAVYALGPDTRDVIGMKTTSGTLMMFIREAEGGGQISLDRRPEVCRLFVDPSAQPGC